MSHPTRLETRTKESITCASHWVFTNPTGEVKATFGGSLSRRLRSVGKTAVGRATSKLLLVDPRTLRRASDRGAPLKGVTFVSACGGTRKMVIYAWRGRSQRKLWWRTEAVLTCKSIVRAGLRGERLIESSSSWFPPKFPLG